MSTPRPPPAVEKLHGRLTERAATAVPATPAATGIPFCRSLVRVECATTRKGVTVRDTRYYTLLPRAVAAAAGRARRQNPAPLEVLRDRQPLDTRQFLQGGRLPVQGAPRHPQPRLAINAAAFAVNTVRSAKRLPVPVQMENYARHPAKAVALVTGSLKMKEG